MLKNPSPSAHSVFLTFVASILVFGLSAQDFGVSIEWKYSADDARRNMEFEGEAAERFDGLPAYSALNELPTDAQISSLSLRSAVFEDMAVPMEQFADVSSTIQLRPAVYSTRGTHILDVILSPFRRTSSGQWQRLVSAEIVVQSEPAVALRSSANFAENSKRATGQWYKMSVTKDGVYKLDRNGLQSLGIDMSSVSPNDINVYGNDQGQLPYDNAEFRYDDLQAKAIEIVGGDDGSFDSGDFIVFYAKGPDKWTYDDALGEFVHSKHLFTDRAHVYVGIGVEAPVRVEQAILPTASADRIVTSFDDYSYFESDLDNIIESGRRLVGEDFTIQSERTFSGDKFRFENIDQNAEATVRVRGAASSSTSGSNFNFETNGGSATFSLSATSTYTLITFKDQARSFFPTSEDLSTTVRFNPTSADAQGWLDYIRINCRRLLRYPSQQMSFRDVSAVQESSTVEYQITDMDTGKVLWDITTSVLPKRVAYTLNGSTASFKGDASTLREYVVFDPTNVFSPALEGPVENQNLHGLNAPDMVIVTAAPFVSVAEKFAEFHRSEGLEVFVTTPQPIYEEFSCGMQDVTAIKSFFRMFYERALGNPNEMVDYLLLIGDGTYQNNTIDPKTSIYLPTHQSKESGSLVSTYVSDDYFGFLDADEVEGGTNDGVDIGIGRIPAKSLEEAEGVFQKTRHYASRNTGMVNGHCVSDEGNVFGDWRTEILLIGDDEDGNQHMEQADDLAQLIEVTNNDFDLSKIFLDAYKQESRPGGARYPDAQNDVAQAIESGKYIVSYTGHGGEVGWAQERIIDVPTIQGFTNRDNLPLLLTATCEFSRFDDPGRTSAGELMLLNPNGGAIALMTTTRLVYSQPNFQLSRAFYHASLQDNQVDYSCLSGSPDFNLPHGMRLGDIMRLTKNCTGGSTNKQNFSLLGDPAIFPARPQDRVSTSNSEDIRAIVSDSLQAVQAIGALQRVTIFGRVEDENGQLMTDFNGIVEPKVYDKERSVVTLQNDGNTLAPFTFSARNSIIYKGKARVTNGEFQYTFIVPKDIGYQAGDGRISYYALSDDGDAKGHVEGFSIGAGAGDYEIAEDVQGPEIDVYLDNQGFVNGGLTNSSPLLMAEFRDEHGINTVGSGIGHDITVTIDGNTANTIVLNEFYEAKLDSFQVGSLEYRLADLSPGEHELTIKVWDIYNNSSTKSIDFVVSDTEELALNHVLNYPNPFTTYTEFMFEHNQSCAFLDVAVQVFTVSGKLVKTIHRTIDTSAGRTDPISWDGRDDFGDRIGRGVYVYKLQVITPNGEKEEQFEKLVILD